ncbi:unnamed protein product [Caenorhabditis angaria]|uniref:Elongator complex protein 5 n=1 Tax=Caenorhabditis angaria TaxID=860376 RepID=A0A9P1MZC5_9PELO|nr:unnamed protein product [Caenorhabditis angaria]
MSFYDLPKNGLVLLNSKSEPNVTSKLVLSGYETEKLVIINHENTKSWFQKFFKNSESSTFLTYTENNFPEVSNCKNVIFIDFSLFCRVFKLSEILRILNKLKKETRVFIPADETIPSNILKQVYSLSNVIYNIRSNQDSFSSTTIIFDKRGRISTQEESITFSESSKPVVKKMKTTEMSRIESIDVKELQSSIDQVSSKEAAEKAARDALQLPYISGRQEDGVAIRDASTRKIRVGGQIVYEPDQADDLDDSDPDDDLNI